MLAMQGNVYYILKQLEDRKALSIIFITLGVIFKLHRRTQLVLHSSIHSLKT